LEQHRLGEAASLIESLKSNAHLIIDTRKRKNFDSFAINFAFQGF